jgi:hypothetical protein
VCDDSVMACSSLRFSTMSWARFNVLVPSITLGSANAAHSYGVCITQSKLQ